MVVLLMADRSETFSWKTLALHQSEIADVHMRDLFVQDSKRFERFSLQLEDILFDFSKNRVTDKTVQLLLSLADHSGLGDQIKGMFSGADVNNTEQRAALHTALRNRSSRPVVVAGHDVMPEIRRVLEQMRVFSDKVRSGEWYGYTGKPISTIVNIGIGGSDLGPRLVTHALKPYALSHLEILFISGVDAYQLEETLSKLAPETTMFIIASKSFTTAETMLNAVAVKGWLVDSLGDSSAVAKHFIAVSANRCAVRDFGINDDSIFDLWDWVGGRYSLWSAVGLPIALAIGMDHFEELLAGAYTMDEHFRTAAWCENIPVIMALLGVWYNNFFAAHSHAILPYDPLLQLLPAFLQQLDMESSGKGCTRDGDALTYATGPIVWGELGMDSQHAFYQFLHQGTALSPCDFLCGGQPVTESYSDHHRWLLANCMAQSQALLSGKTESCARKELFEAGLTDEETEQLVHHKVFSGNRPSNTILYRQLTPRVLGSLLAMYEHRTFVQGVMWDINSFDQWGVELGKSLAKGLNRELLAGKKIEGHDSSTNGLLNRCLNWSL